VGNYPIAISQGTLTATNYTFSFAPGSLTVMPPTFTITLTPTTTSIPGGQVGVVTVTVTPSIAYTGTVSLSCGALPANVVCTFTGTSLPINGSSASTQLNISTNGYPEVSSLRSDGSRKKISQHAEIICLSFGLPFLPLSFFFKRRMRCGIQVLLAMLVLVALQNLNGCTQPVKIAAPFSGNITVIGTDTNNVTAQATLAVTIS
jgi:hypothetical protein